MYRVIAFDPVDDFIETLDGDTIGKLLRALNLLETQGYRLGMPHSKHIVGKIYELRVRGKIEIRIFYGYYTSIIYLLHGFVKKAQKTPIRELKIAEQRMVSLTRT